jgi:CubicO group peptidase (beta-lactamase class C family)
MSICIDDLESLLNKAYEKGYFSGCVLLAEKNKVLLRKALGIANEKNKQPIKENSIFNLASVSKQFTASAIMLLCQRGVMGLDEPLEKYFPKTKFYGRTIRNLLNHTCGLPDYMEWVDRLAKAESCIPDNSIIEKFLSEVPSKELFAPDTRFAYSNTGYSALAYIVQKVSGTSYGDFLKNEIFMPAGMKDTLVYHPYKVKEKIDNYAYGYVLEGGNYVLPEQSKNSGFAITLDGIEGDGAVFSTIDDMYAWDRALKNGKVISSDIQKEMYTPTHYGEGEIQNYGFGWNMADDPEMGFTVFHSGSWPGYNTEFRRYLDRDITLIVLMNQSGCDCRGRKTFLEGIGDILRGKNPGPMVSTDETIDKSISVENYRKYCGDYEGNIRLWIDNGAIYISFIFRAEMEMKTRLYPAGGSRFVTYLTPQDIIIDSAGITGRFERKLKTYRKL